MGGIPASRRCRHFVVNASLLVESASCRRTVNRAPVCRRRDSHILIKDSAGNTDVGWVHTTITGRISSGRLRVAHTFSTEPARRWTTGSESPCASTEPRGRGRWKQASASSARLRLPGAARRHAVQHAEHRGSRGDGGDQIAGGRTGARVQGGECAARGRAAPALDPLRRILAVRLDEGVGDGVDEVVFAIISCSRVKHRSGSPRPFSPGRFRSALRPLASTRPRRPERAYMDILKNVTRSG